MISSWRRHAQGGARLRPAPCLPRSLSLLSIFAPGDGVRAGTSLPHGCSPQGVTVLCKCRSPG